MTKAGEALLKVVDDMLVAESWGSWQGIPTSDELPALVRSVEDEVVDLTLDTLQDVMDRAHFGVIVLTREEIGAAMDEVKRRMDLRP